MQLYSAYIYEANSSLKVKSKTRIVIYYVIASSGHVLASSLELWLLRYDDLLYFAWFVQRANKSSVYNRNNTPRSNLALASFSSILLWSRNMFRCFLELSTSWEIVIFHLEFFTQNMQHQGRSYSQCQSSNIVMCKVPTLLHTLSNDTRV